MAGKGRSKQQQRRCWDFRHLHFVVFRYFETRFTFPFNGLCSCGRAERSRA
jgi:hypothetical protein